MQEQLTEHISYDLEILRLLEEENGKIPWKRIFEWYKKWPKEDQTLLTSLLKHSPHIPLNQDNHDARLLLAYAYFLRKSEIQGVAYLKYFRDYGNQYLAKCQEGPAFLFVYSSVKNQHADQGKSGLFLEKETAKDFVRFLIRITSPQRPSQKTKTEWLRKDFKRFLESFPCFKKSKKDLKKILNNMSIEDLALFLNLLWYEMSLARDTKSGGIKFTQLQEASRFAREVEKNLEERLTKALAETDPQNRNEQAGEILTVKWKRPVNYALQNPGLTALHLKKLKPGKIHQEEIEKTKIGGSSARDLAADISSIFTGVKHAFEVIGIILKKK